MSRIAVVQTLFAWEFRGGEADFILDYILRHLHPKLDSLDFAKNSLKGILAKREEIQDIITELAPEWEFEKIAPVDRVILELGVYEIIASDDVPPIVAINEAIEIAKSLGTENSAKFINGVLSAVMKKYKPQSYAK
ncbi:MAG: NusB antitermination factor, N utilization substance protein B [Candidatus Peregrinibacteria bacterium GW2011_GWF2_39_17]|nr:MAG: NusB antitermination factor, N utilization substance protein B [Candidatus Peregrinibacteria bacterium GW2011_GWF2_39_17]